MKGKLQDQTAIITGAGSGIGKAIAQFFAQEGASVVVADVNLNSAQETADSIKSGNGKAIAIELNVADQSSVKEMMDRVQKFSDRLDILVNNAGIMDDFVPVKDLSDEQWDRVMDVNLNGPFYTSRAALKPMLEKGKGNIINIISVGGLFGNRAGAAYTASKHGLVGLTKNIAFMYAQAGIRCNGIAPGGVETHISDNMKPHELGYQRMTSGASNMPRFGQPMEIAQVALFLASDESSFINGSIVTADGGWTAY